MERIIESVTAMMLVSAALFFYAVSGTLAVAFYATLSLDAGNSDGLFRAAGWLAFLAGLAGLAAVAYTAWERVLRADWIAVAETAFATIATMLFMVGLLIAASSPAGDSAANVVQAVGIGMWALLALSRAARLSLTEQVPAGKGPAVSRLTAACGLFLTAVGVGLGNAGSTSGTITAGVITAAGIGTIGAALFTARQRSSLRSRTATGTTAGLAVLTAGILASAIAAGLASGSSWSPTTTRTALASTAAVVLVAFVILGSTAWNQVRRLYRDQHAPRPGTSGPP